MAESEKTALLLDTPEANPSRAAALEIALGAPEPKLDPKTEPGPDLERPSYSERARLNAVYSFYTGTLAGAFDLYHTYRKSYLQDGEEETPDRRIEMEFYRPQYEKIRHDLERYERLSGFSNFGEAAAAFVGQLGPTFLTPETYIAPPIWGATLLARALSAGSGQAIIQAGADLPTQWLTIQSRVQTGFDPIRTVASAMLGVVAGATLHATKEIIAGHPVSNLPLSSVHLGENATGVTTIDRNTTRFVHVMREMKQSLESGSGRHFGTKMHTEIESRVGTKNFSGIGEEGIELSFSHGSPHARYGSKRSIRPDFVQRSWFSGRHFAAYEFKTGRDEVDAKRVQALREQIGHAVRVIELNYDKLKATKR